MWGQEINENLSFLLSFAVNLKLLQKKRSLKKKKIIRKKKKKSGGWGGDKALDINPTQVSSLYGEKEK